jgi:uncharacterized repeat protein (TIGR03803 family)
MKNGSISATARRINASAHAQDWVRHELGAWVLALAIISSVAAIAMPLAHSQTFTQLHSFIGGKKDGASSYSGMINVGGTLYGTTSGGGAHGFGTVFKITSAGKESLLYSFKGPPNDGADPSYINLVSDSKGNLYGATSHGGNGPCTDSGSPAGCGTVFKVTSAGKESVLYNFMGAPDGFGPDGGLIMDSTGSLYGATYAGGVLNSGCQGGCGTVFKITSAGAESVLYKFAAKAKAADGAGPQGNIAIDASGNLYGTTLGGGKHLSGTVYKLTASGKESVLYSFCAEKNCKDGELPYGGVVLGAKVNLYGTTGTGGTGVCGSGTCGTIFTVNTSGNGFGVLYSFAGPPNDGFLPVGGLAIDAAENLYGTTFSGGLYLYGTVFVFAGGSESVLHSFNFNGTDGVQPEGSLSIDSTGNVYGTTVFGGSGTACDSGVGCGTAFKITP